MHAGMYEFMFGTKRECEKVSRRFAITLKLYLSG